MRQNNNFIYINDNIQDFQSIGFDITIHLKIQIILFFGAPDIEVLVEVSVEKEEELILINIIYIYGDNIANFPFI